MKRPDLTRSRLPPPSLTYRWRQSSPARQRCSCRHTDTALQAVYSPSGWGLHVSWKDVAVRGEGEIQNQGEHCLVPSVAELNRPQLIFFFFLKK